MASCFAVLSVECNIVEADDYVEVGGVVFHKPFVEKPLNAEDHNVHIYFPTSAGGGSQRLFRKVSYEIVNVILFWVYNNSFLLQFHWGEYIELHWPDSGFHSPSIWLFFHCGALHFAY